MVCYISWEDGNGKLDRRHVFAHVEYSGLLRQSVGFWEHPHAWIAPSASQSQACYCQSWKMEGQRKCINGSRENQPLLLPWWWEDLASLGLSTQYHVTFLHTDRVILGQSPSSLQSPCAKK